MWLCMTWQYYWGVHWYPKVQSASVLKQWSGPFIQLRSLGSRAEPWPSGTDLLSSSQTFPWLLYWQGKWGCYNMTHIPKRAWQAALSSQRLQWPPPVSLRGKIQVRVFLQGYNRIKTGLFFIFLCVHCAHIHKSNSQTFSCDLGLRKIMAVPDTSSETVNDKCPCQPSAW